MRSLVIGGTRGIGAAIARRLAQEGEIRVCGQDDALTGDEPLDALVLAQRHRGDDLWLGEFQTALDVSRRAIEFAADRMRGGGAIVAITSVASAHITADQPAGYHAMKAALAQLVRYYAVALGPKQIRVNAIAPGTTVKDESRDYYTRHADIRSVFARMVPLGRMGTADDIAELTAFLVSPQASFLTGQELVLDGGASLHTQESIARQMAGV